MTRRNNKGLATWVKWLLGILIVGFALTLATCGAGAFIVYQQIQKAMDPVNVQQVASQLATIKELPPSYKYAFGMDFMGAMTIVAVQNETAKMTYMLIKVPNTDGMSADQFVEQMAQKGVPTAGAGGQSTTKIEVKDKGKTPVGGTEMPYIVGISENSSSGKKQPAFMGCVMPSKDTAVLVAAVSNEEETKPIDVNEVKNFLGLIEAFKGNP